MISPDLEEMKLDMEPYFETVGELEAYLESFCMEIASSASKQDDRVKRAAEKALRKRAEEGGFVFEDNKGKGDCLPYSILDSLMEADKDRYDELFSTKSKEEAMLKVVTTVIVL